MFLRGNRSGHVEGVLKGEEPSWAVAALGPGEGTHVGGTGDGGPDLSGHRVRCGLTGAVAVMLCKA